MAEDDAEQAGLFDHAEAIRRRDEALDRLEVTRQSALAAGRHAARKIAKERGEVVADDVRAALVRQGYQFDRWNFLGGVFRGKEWRFDGDFRRSGIAKGHGNMQRVWRLR